MHMTHKDIQEVKAELLELKFSVQQRLTQFETRLATVEAGVEAYTSSTDQLLNEPFVYQDNFKELYQNPTPFIQPKEEETEPDAEITPIPSEELAIPEEESFAEAIAATEDVVEVPTEEASTDRIEEEVAVPEALAEEERVISFQELVYQPKEEAEAEVAIEEEEKEAIVVEVKAPSATAQAFEKAKDSALEAFFAPIAQFKSYFLEIYFHYKRQNKLPVFFMTIGGMAALLFGFGYLMQEASSFFYEVAKTVAGFAAAGGALLWGKTLIKNHEKYNEFGSALFGLGISLSYLMMYFLSSSTVFPIFNGPIIGLLLILLNTLLATWLALRFETRIVAVLSLIGGAFAPFYLNQAVTSPFYFTYLWLLCVASIYVAGKISWKPLGTLAFLVTTAVTEFVVFESADSLSLPIFTLLFHAFLYLFLYYALFEKRQPKFSLIKEEVLIVAVSVSVFLLNMYLLYDVATFTGAKTILGIIYLANAGVMIGGFFRFRNQLPKPMQLLFFILAGSFAGLAVPALFGQEFMSLFWGLEGIALITCGFLFHLYDVRKEGYIITLVAVAYSIFTWSTIAEQWGVQLWTLGFANYLILGGIILILHLLLTASFPFKGIEGDRSSGERLLSKILLEGFSFWMMGCWTIAGQFYLGDLWYNLAIIPMLGLAWWGNKKNLKITEWLGLKQFLLLGYAAIISIQEVESLRFTSQTILGKFAYGEIVLLLWGLQLFYEKLMPNSKNLVIMKVLREAFYIAVPWMVLTFTRRYAPEFIPLGFALSAALAFGLWELLKKQQMIFAKSIIRNQGYLHIGIYTLLSVIYGTQIVDLIVFGLDIWSIEFLHLVSLGPIYLALRMYINKVRQDCTENERHFSYVILEGLSFWASAMFLMVGSYFLEEWIIPISAVAMFVFTWWADQQKLRATEWLGILYYGLIIIGLVAEVSAQDGLSVFKHHTYGIILMLESVALLWLMPFFYQKVIKNSPLQGMMTRANTLFWLLIPLVGLPTFVDQFPDSTTLGLWAAALIAFVIHEQLQKLESLKELNVLIIIGTFAMIVELAVIPALVGLALIFGIFIYKKGFLLSSYLSEDDNPNNQKSPYSFLFTYAIYFLGLIVTLLYADITNEVVGMPLVAAMYLFAVTYFREHIHALRSNYRFAYHLGNAMMLVGVSLLLADAYSFESLHKHTGYLITVISIGITALAVRGILVYREQENLALYKQTSNWQISVIVFHLFTIAAYSSFTYMISEDWSRVVLTILLTIHAIILLFNSANPKYKFLLKMSILVFAVTGLKLKFYDMQGTETVKQVVVLMVVGVILLIAANLFAKVRKSWEEKEEILVDTNKESE